MLEDVIFGQMTMPGELIRVLIAFIGTAVASYYDLYNKKNVPDNVLYAFLAIAFIVNLVFFQEDLFWFSLAVAAFFSAIGYIFYRVGQLGGADVFVLASIMLLLPIHPSFVGMAFNLPFIFSVIVFSGVLFALYVMVYFGYKLYKVEAKANWLYLLMFIPYLLFAWVYVNSFLFSPVYFAFITILLFASIFFLMFKKPLMGVLSESLPVSQLEAEDVLALEVMNKDLVERYKLKRLLTKGEIERLKATKVEEVTVYTKLPPFLPFVLIGMVLALLFGSSLLLL
jgi:Flp pilus assembly protein protease CpaA